VKRVLALGSIVALVAAPASSGAAPVIRSSVSPATPAFGDPFTYTVTVSVPAARSESTTVATDVGLLTRVASAKTTRSVEHGIALVVVTERLACLAESCVDRASGRSIAIPSARVRVGAAEYRGAPVSVQIRTRVPDDAVRARKPAFLRPSGVSPVTARVDPGRLRGALVAAGCVLLVGGLGALTLPVFRRRAPRKPAGRADPLRRAIRLLRDSTGRNDADRRRAASHVGRLVGETTLAADAARVAWSRPEPGIDDVTDLADRAERTARGHP
jgi:hypothetical protein